MKHGTRMPDAQSRRILTFARIFIVVIAVLLALTVTRIVQLKLHPGQDLQETVGTRESTLSTVALRGRILDRRGRVAAMSVVGYRLFADPALIIQEADRDDEDPLATTADEIASRTGMNASVIETSLKKKAKARYVPLSHQLEDWQVVNLQRKSIKGVGIQPRLVRMNPQHDTAASLVGFVGFEHSGLGGIEHKYQQDLVPDDGKLTYLRDSRGRPLWSDAENYVLSRNGSDIRLTIDLAIQAMAEKRLGQAVKEFNAGGGRVVILDSANGNILAMCDMLNPRSGMESIAVDPGRKLHPALGRNRCVTDPYEPGSTFKPFIWSIGTEIGAARPTEILPTPSPSDGIHLTSTGRRIRDVKYYGPVSWDTVLIKSLNSGMAIVAERLSRKQMQDAVKRFAFGEHTRCGLPGESRGIVTSAGKWTSHSQCSVAMGHEIAVTPVQMVRGFAAFCNNGLIPDLRLVSQDREEMEFSTRRSAIKGSTARQVRNLLARVMTEGTGRRAQSDQYQIFGKSGTAQLVRPRAKGGGYYEDRYVSSFIGGAPLDHPRIVVLCVIDDPDRRKGHYGGVVAGPVVRDLVDSTLSYLGVPADKEGAPELTVSVQP
ncbi:MAG: hypothetical protein CMJ32_06495 [Phycisphaerae bacterium]|nr:hypothetical protein [Phycisphaerae bacterium]